MCKNGDWVDPVVEIGKHFKAIAINMFKDIQTIMMAIMGYYVESLSKNCKLF